MVKNKFRLLPGVYIIIVLLLVSTTYAHSGRTDAGGGHYNQSTGEYHYHHGYPAHKHTNGVCPYDFDDKTGWSSGTSTGNSSSSDRNNQIYKGQWESPGQHAKRQDQFEEQSAAESNNKRTFWDVVLPVFLLLVLAWPALIYPAALFFFILSAVFELPGLRRLKRKWEARQKEKQELKRQRAELLRLEQWNAERQKAVGFFNGESARQKACVPDGVMFSGNHWPISINGNSILVCLNKDRTRYHKPTCRYAKGITPISLYQIGSRCIPCSVCRPATFAGVPDWLVNYRRYIQIKTDYQIDDPDLPKKSEAEEIK